MARAVAVVEKAWSVYANEINAAWQRGVESILEVGRILVRARDDKNMKHGSFEMMIRTKLPFNESTAQRLMKIAEHAVLSKAAHVQLLPPSWGTLYELTKVPEPKLIAAINDGTVNPKMQRRDVKALLPAKASRPRKSEASKTGPKSGTDPRLDCVMAVRSVVLEWLPEIPTEQWPQLISDLREAVDAIERGVQERMKRTGNGHHATHEPA